MSERDLSGIWFTGERERNISGALCFDRERLSGILGGVSRRSASLTCSDDNKQCGVIKHIKSACLPIIESKSTIDHNRKLLQALDDVKSI